MKAPRAIRGRGGPRKCALWEGVRHAWLAFGSGDFHPLARLRADGAGERVAPRRLDILSEADAPKKALVKELKGIGPAAALTVSLRRVSGKARLLCAWR